MEEIEQRRREREAQEHTHQGDDDEETDDAGKDSGEEETDDEDDDYGPTPAAGVWAGSQKLQAESDALEDDEDHDKAHVTKKQRTD